jgi:hypothetical protein
LKRKIDADDFQNKDREVHSQHFENKKGENTDIDIEYSTFRHD